MSIRPARKSSLLFGKTMQRRRNMVKALRQRFSESNPLEFYGNCMGARR